MPLSRRATLGVVVALLCKKTHIFADPTGDDPEAGMLDFMDPTLAGGSFHVPGWDARPVRIQHCPANEAYRALYRVSFDLKQPSVCRAGYDHTMPVVLFKCPIMRQHVSAWVADDGGSSAEADRAETIVCAACSRVHLVNPKTGKVIGAHDD